VRALGDFLLAPAPAPERVGARPPLRGAVAPASVGVVAPGPALTGVACAAGVVLARRGVLPVVCLYTGTGAGVAARRRGRVLVIELPGDADEAAREVHVVRATAGGAPYVLGVALRAAALDPLLSVVDGLLVVSPAGETLGELAWRSATALGAPAARAPAPAGPVARVLARAGLAAPGGVRRALSEVMR
jgi:hypothetical protein